MPNARRSHHPRSQEERREYVNEVLRDPGPTIEDPAPIIDSTDQLAAPLSSQIGGAQSTRAASVVGQFLKDKLFEILLLAVLIPSFGWTLHSLYSLNREVGELTSSLDNTNKTQTILESELNAVEERMMERIRGITSHLNRMDGRIDGLIDARDNRRSPGE